MPATPKPDCLFFGTNGRVTAGRGGFSRYASMPDEPAFYVNDFSLSHPQPWLVPERLESLTEADFPESSPPSIRWSAVEQEMFKMVFRRIRLEVLRGGFEKMVPVLTQKGTFTAGDPSALFRRLTQTGAGKFAYGGSLDGEGFAGITPETLFQLQDSELTAMALAGTASPAREDQFFSDAKEALEQALVADWVEERLTRLGVASREQREVLESNGLTHLVTFFHLRNPSGNVDEWIRLLHPTPAVGCLPVDGKAAETLNASRMQLGVPPAFAAPFGFRDEQGNVTVVVRIRGVFWRGAEIFLPSGCGVVRGSMFDHEWRELAMKRHSTRVALGV